MSESAQPTPPADGGEYDYVIVGSGAGGAPLAARLAELKYSVLVLEAGPLTADGSSAHKISQVPAMHAPSSEHPDISWGFFVDHYAKPQQPDPKALNGKIFYPRATGVGGCTIHNAMITIAGPAADWDELADRLGDPSWAADVMRGYFQRLERCEYLPRPKRPRTARERLHDLFNWLVGRDADPTAGRHGFDGWLHTSVIDLKIGLKDEQLIKMLEAAAVTAWRAGLEAPKKLVKQILRGEFSEALDPNNFRRQTDRPEGLVLIPTAIVSKEPETADDPKRGHRSSPVAQLQKAFLANSGCKILTDCLVTKVVLQTDPLGHLRATGVEYRPGAKLYRANLSPSKEDVAPIYVRAREEVILCGGAFNTPQLLMLSGIGPAEHLISHKIQCLVDSPGVGRNLQDRYEVTVVSKMAKPFSVLAGATFKIPTDGSSDKCLKEWDATGTGLYATNGAVLGIFKRSRPDLAQPDLFIFGIPLKFQGYKVGYSDVDPNTFDLFTWAILKAHTQNTGGTVELNTNDPCDVPLVNFNYFGSSKTKPPNDEDDDLKALVEGVRFVREIAAEPGVGAREYFPGPGNDGNADVRDWIKRDAWGHHACGTCRMGRWNDPMAVIDGGFRVLGGVHPDQPRAPRRPVDRLRVVDASIFPNIPGYFIVSNIYMASEKAADVIHQSALSRKLHPRATPGTGGTTP